jgi:hypothetical protein
MAEADARQVFVSEATATRACGAGLTFADRGVRVLKGVSGEHRILEIVTSQSAYAAAAEMPAAIGRRQVQSGYRRGRSS